MGVNTGRTWALLVLAGVVAAVLGTFAPVVRFDFVVFDDDINIVLNPHLGELNAEAWRWLWTDTSYMRRYLPLGWLAFFTLFRMGGLDPSYYHAANLLVHTLNAALVLFACTQLLSWRARETGEALSPVIRWALAGLAALLWACHPMRVESVAWASGMLYLLSVTAALVAWILFVHAETHEVSAGWRWTSIGAFVASALVYPVALGLPCLVFAWRWGRWAAHRRPLGVASVVPYAVISALTLAAAVYARTGGAEAPTTSGVSAITRLSRTTFIWVDYLWRPFWPVELSPVYDSLLETSWLAWLLSALVVAAVTGAAVARRRVWPWLLPLWCGYLACMLPHAGLLEGPFFPADRYGYFVGTAQAMVLAVLGREWMRRVGSAGWLMAAAAAACGVLAFGARDQTWVWRDSDALFARIDRAVSLPWVRASYRMRYAAVLTAQGRYSEAQKVEREAAGLAPETDLSKPRKLVRDFAELGETAGMPPFAVQHHSLALAHLKKADAIGAFAHLRRALEIAPSYDIARYNLALALAESARPREALAHFFWVDRATLPRQQRDGFWRMLAAGFRARGEEHLAVAAEKQRARPRS